MIFALNYSPQAADLLMDGQIVFDRFKCPAPFDPVIRQHAPDLIDRARAAKPIYYHFPLFAGDDSLATIDPNEIERLLAEADTPHVNLHLRAGPAEFPDIPIASTAPGHLQAVANRMIGEIVAFSAPFGLERVVAENVVYRGPTGSSLAAVTEPTLIAHVVRESGCGLLLDLAHARLTALELGIPPQDYLAAFPMERLRELHVTGIASEGRNRRDSMPMEPADWDLVEWALGEIGAGRWATPRIVALEYGGVGPAFAWRSDSAVLAEQVPRLKAQLSAAFDDP